MENVIRFSCWACSTELTVPVSMAGVQGPCPVCGQTLAAPAAPPTVLLTPATTTTGSALSYASPSPIADGFPAHGDSTTSGYRRPLPPVSPPPAQKSGKSTSAYAQWEACIVIPFLLSAENMQGKFLGAMIGALAWRFSLYLLKDTRSQLTRIGGLAAVLGIAFVVFVETCDALELPLRHRLGIGSLTEDKDGSKDPRAADLAYIRSLVEKRKPGLFTEADHRAAHAAVLKSNRHDIMSMTMLYGETLRTRLDAR